MIPKFKTVLELIKAFPDNKACHQYLAIERWNGYMECPYAECNGNDPYIFSDGIRYKCKYCKRIYKATTGTAMEGTKIPLIHWFMAFYLLMHKKGISSKQLAKDIGVSYPTAWFIEHRIRLVLGNEKKEKLHGIVEIDETFVGGKNKNRHKDKKVSNSQGRTFIDKTPVMGLMQKEEYEIIERPHKKYPALTVKEKIITNPGIVKSIVISSTRADVLQPIIKNNIMKGSAIVTDEWQGYFGLPYKDYNHQVVDHGSKQYVNNLGYTSNAIESHWSQFKRGIIDIYIQISRKHMQKYVNEFSFKYNYRNHSIQDQFNIFISNMNVRLKYKELIA